MNAPSPARPSVLVVVPWLMGGGAQKALEALLARLDPVDVSLLVLFRGSTDVAAVARHASKVTELDQPRSVLGVLVAARGAVRAARDADAIYSLMRASHVVLGVRARAVRRSAGSVVCSFHQLPSADEGGGGGAARVRARLESVLVRRLTRRADLVTAPSRRAVEEIVARRFADRGRATFEANEVATVAMEDVPARDGFADEVRLAFAGRLTDQKGLDRLPGLLADLDCPLHLRIAGTGPEEQDLRVALSSLPTGVTVTFEGPLADVTPLLDWCDAILMPSRAELNPVVVAEARRRSRGLLGSRIPAFVDLAEEGGVRLFADGPELVARIAELREPETRRRLSGEAFAAATRRDGPSRIIEALRTETT
ncbi:glycosyltransferase family 4 protein [Litorihabitans aurantiacus]|uniref:D-inositol 3-phosphate glycosyltransferase n=1 Tax=Litorihabitans aurantiacus TaxID=1930061 RepID=A0AA37UNZ2_9MICO|nr:glycosyltransferase family 4 protein [Litorihabitans aurantiacus]GMA30386.1 hypothetical protein GCM10025875_03780 [Litorihabitans aurantiacus]